MNARRNNEIKTAVAALSVAAAVATGLLAGGDAANAAPPAKQTKKSTVTVKRSAKQKPIYVKMTGDRRAAETRAQQLYTQALAEQQAQEQQRVAEAEAARQAQSNAANNGTTTVASNSTPPQNGFYNPYGMSVQQVNIPGTGPFGPVVVGGGFGPFNGGAISGFPFSGFGGAGYPSNGGSGFPGYPGNGPAFNGSGGGGLFLGF